MLGLPGGSLELVPYHDEWPCLFEREKRRLQEVVGQHVLEVQHIGSTAIPGMIAKPILDIGVAVADFEEARVCAEPIEALGYTYRGEHGIPQRHYFVKGDPRTHHIHMVEIHHPGWESSRLFRDYLIEHPEAAEEYASLKRRLAEVHANDRHAYGEGKGPFIERIVQMARTERPRDR